MTLRTEVPAGQPAELGPLTTRVRPVSTIEGQPSGADEEPAADRTLRMRESHQLHRTIRSQAFGWS
jgi:hypothetical protein